jgi:hypothetical protein
MGSFLALREKLTGKPRRTKSRVFDPRSTTEKYAFHWGGRTELQFHIGLDCYKGTLFFRHGVAFSLEPSQSYPDPVDFLRPKVKRFNKYVREAGARFPDMLMWNWYREEYPDQERSENYAIQEIPGALVARYYFIFTGKLTSQGSVTADDVLADFDRLLDMYEFVEGGSA